MDAIEINSILLNENFPPNDLPLQYRADVIPSILNHWNELNTSTNLENMDLISGYLRYRIKLGLTTDLPQFLGDHYYFMRFFRGIFDLYLSNQAILINVSPTLILYDESQNHYNLLYASTNFFFWENAKSIHNQQTKDIFFSDLSNIDLRSELNKATAALSEKYESMELILIALHFRSVKVIS